MTEKIAEVLAEALKRITPTSQDKKRVLELAKNLQRRVEVAARKAKAPVEVRVEGSIAKNTWLREFPDIDIFMRVPEIVPRETFATLYLDIAKEATSEAKQVERYAEHPYLEAFFDNVRVNIVPCYRVKKGEWISATDRTPFHTDYVKPLLNEELCGHIRLLKQFMKGIGVYGAEIKVGGFSGYLCELLVLFYGGFLQVLEAAVEWNNNIYIDLGSHYENTESTLKRIFTEPLVIIDPVDKGRNAASAVRKERLDEFVAASRGLLRKPAGEFFFPPKKNSFCSEELLQQMRSRGSALVFILFRGAKTVPDILWGQLYKSQRALRKLARRYGFRVIRDDTWSDENGLNAFLIELKHRRLPHLRKHFGPPLEKKEECTVFLQKYVGSKRLLSGPQIMDGRWVVEIRREYVDIVELFEDKLEDGGKDVGVANLISEALIENLEIRVNAEILTMYSRNKDFAKFVTTYLKGQVRWLT